MSDSVSGEIDTKHFPCERFPLAEPEHEHQETEVPEGLVEERRMDLNVLDSIVQDQMVKEIL